MFPDTFRGCSGATEDLGDLDFDVEALEAERAARRSRRAPSLSWSLVGGGEAWMEAEVMMMGLALLELGESSQREIVWLRILDKELKEVIVVEDGLVEGKTDRSGEDCGGCCPFDGVGGRDGGVQDISEVFSVVAS